MANESSFKQIIRPTFAVVPSDKQIAIESARVAHSSLVEYFQGKLNESALMNVFAHIHAETRREMYGAAVQKWDQEEKNEAFND